MQRRNISLNNLLFVKEDIILPHSVSFHDLIKKRVRGRTGPLFDFGVHDDVRAESDSRIQEKTDAHAGLPHPYRLSCLHYFKPLLVMQQAALDLDCNEPLNACCKS